MIKVIITFFFFFLSGSRGLELTNFLLPYDNKIVYENIFNDILMARKRVIIVMYMFTNIKLLNILIKKAKKDNVKIIVIGDKSFNKNKISKLKYLVEHKNKNIKIFLANGVLKNGKRGILHAKIILIDDKIVYIGSANWTNSAFSRNYEVLLKIKDNTIAKLYECYISKILDKSKLFVKN